MVMTPAPVSQMHWHHWLSCRADREHVKLDRDVMLPALVGVSLLTPNLPKPDVSTVKCFPKFACQCAVTRLRLEAPGLSISSGSALSSLCNLSESPFAGL